jgi:pilus assembly protein CpaE
VSAEAHSRRPISVLALLRSAEADIGLQEAARALDNVRIESRQGGLAGVGDAPLGGLGHTVLLIDVRFDDEADMAALERLTSRHGGELAIIATSNSAPIQGVRQLMRLGIPDFLPQPIAADDLAAALGEAARRGAAVERKPGSPQRQRKIISFIKPCGGLGATSLAVQTAYTLAAAGKNGVCLLDFDLQFGNAALYLDVDNHLNLFNIIDAPDRLDGSFLRGLMAHHPSGIDVLPGPQFVVPLDALTPDLAVRILDIAAAEYEYVVVDMPQAWALWTHGVLSHSSVVVFVAQFTVPALRQGRRVLDTLRQEGLENLPLITLMNRYERSVFKREIGSKEAEKALGRPVDALVDNDFKTVSQALNEGVPIAQISGGDRIEKQIIELVALIDERLVEAQPQESVS